MSEINYQLISPGQIDVEALADYIILSRNIVFRKGEEETSSNIAQDVDKVGGIESGLIAVAIDKENRETVKNALELNGIPASEYMTLTIGASIADKQLKMKKAYGDEIKELKDELYQIKNQLAKNGMVKNDGQYSGYHDIFRSNSFSHLKDALGIAETYGTDSNDQIIINDQTLFDSLTVYDFIVLENAAIKKFTIKQIAEKKDDGRTIVLDSPVDSGIMSNELNLYKSKGIIHEGMFKFANDAENVIGAQEWYTGLSDDTYNSVKRINISNTGFGYSFRVPEAKQGFITNFEICTKATGNPGALMCYIIDERDVEKFSNATQAEAAYIESKELGNDNFLFFAKSKPLTISSALGKRYVKFDFMQTDGSYPLMPKETGVPKRYVAIIECLSADTANCYDLVFVQNKKNDGELGDLELNNTTYNYVRQNDYSSMNALTTNETINNFDLYYHIVTRENIENEPEPQKEGLYTARFKAKDNFLGSKARLMLRIRREGCFNTLIPETTPTVYTFNNIKLENADTDNGVKTIDELKLKGDIYKRLEERVNEGDISQQVTTIIGNNIVKIQGLGDDYITTQTPVLINSKDPVYRVGYQVSLKARTIEFDANTGNYSIGDYDHYILPLKEVIKDIGKRTDDSSDRLIFETNLFESDAKIKNYNDFEIQVFWENKQLSAYYDIRNSQMGAVKELVLSLDRAF